MEVIFQTGCGTAMIKKLKNGSNSEYGYLLEPRTETALLYGRKSEWFEGKYKFRYP